MFDKKSMISNEVEKQNALHAVGRIMLHNFLKSNDDQNVKSTIVVMDEVLQQMDT